MTSDPDKLWLEPEGCDNRNCSMLLGPFRMNRVRFDVRPKPCPTCGRQPTEYVKKEE